MRSGGARLLGAAALALAVGGVLGPASAAAAEKDERFGVVDLFLALQEDNVETVDVVAGFDSPAVTLFFATRGD